MHCSSNSKSLWNDPASRSRRAFSTVLPNRTTWGNQAKSDKIENLSLSTVSCSSRWMDTKETFHILMRKHSESAWTTAPVEASTGKAVQQYDGSQIIRIGSERKEFTNGTTGEACLAKPSVERLPKAKTPFRLLLIVLTEGGLWMSREVLKKD